MSKSSTAHHTFVAPMPVIMRALGLAADPGGIPEIREGDAKSDPPGDDADRAA